MTTKAPLFNSFNALKPIPPRSGVTAVLDAAAEIHGRCADVSRLARDNRKLREQNQALLSRVTELTRDADDAARTIGDLIAENAQLRCRLDELEDDGSLAQQLQETGRELLAARAELCRVRSGRDSLRAAVSTGVQL